MARILVIDDDTAGLTLLASILENQGYEVETATNGREGIQLIDGNRFDVVITDLSMPEVDGIGVLEHLSAFFPDTLCIILTGYGSIENSVAAMKKGAFDYITKPIKASELQLLVERALRFKHLEAENTQLKRDLKRKYCFSNIVGTSPAIQKIYELIDKVADTDGTILITGPSGTGKELIARAIHYGSSRSEKPLVVINCGAIPEELLESEIFGHEKGAFTGAHKSRMGRFEMASGGTIFLDEIGEMSPALQVKLLRVLQEQTFERVGGMKTIHVDVRIIAATNQNLVDAINKGSFREDLYYRLNVIPIKVPPLKQRKTDIPLLIDHFRQKFSNGNRQSLKGISSRAMEALMQYDWPGNVRELENLVKRFSILCANKRVDIDDLPETIQVGLKEHRPVRPIILDRDISLTDAVKQYEKDLILQALENSNWVKSAAAKMLNINRTTLVEKIKKQKLERQASG
jgi:DNA-binding NtrC family response regulator